MVGYHINAYNKALIERSDANTFDPNIIEAILIGFYMLIKILDATARITTYCLSFLELIKGVVYCFSFVHNKLKS